MTEPDWLAGARADLGTKEVAGAKANARVLQYYADAGHPEVKSDEVSWCGAFVAAHLKRCGYPITSEPLLARSWRRYGKKLDEPQEGAIAVFWRESPSSWKGHVGFVVSWTSKTVKVLGGNQGNGVTIQSFPRSQLLELRWPVAATAKALKDAGSTEVAMAVKVRDVAVGVGVVSGAVKAVKEVSAMEVINTTGEHMTALKPVLEATDAVIDLLAQNAWLLGLAVAVAGFLVARWIIAKRIERHELGHPLSRAG